jgi:branched-chain amino acid transport system permease protein
VFSPILLGQVFVNGVSLSAIYILVALGFTLLFGIMRVVNFAHGSFAMLGGYALYYFYGQWGFPYLLAAPLAAISVALASLILERFVFRLFYQKMFQSMIALLGLDMAITFTALMVWDPYERSIPSPLDGVLQVGGLVIPEDKLVISIVAAIALAAFWIFTRYTKYGLALRAASQDLEIAEAQGVNTTTLYRLAFLIAIFTAALAGGFYAQTYSLSPMMGERPLLMAFIVVILGGMGSIPGVALGGMLLGFSESALSTFYGSAVSTFASFGVVFLLLIFRPWGLLGTPEND